MEVRVDHRMQTADASVWGPLLSALMGVDWPHIFRARYLGVHTQGRLEALQNLH